MKNDLNKSGFDKFIDMLDEPNKKRRRRQTDYMGQSGASFLRGWIALGLVFGYPLMNFLVWMSIIMWIIEKVG